MKIALAMCFLVPATVAFGGGVTGPNGINSDVTTLDGFGVLIGMVERGHPARDGKENELVTVPHVNPAGVFFGTLNTQATAGQQLSPIEDESGPNHATYVAEVLNGSTASGALFTGVAPNASLFAAAIPISDNRGGTLTLNAMAQRTINPPLANADRMWAINMSYNSPIQGPIESLDGTSHLTQFVDWSAKEHDVLYVVSWPNKTNQISAPSDNYNGITVGSSVPIDQNFTEVSELVNANPRFGYDATGPRTSIHLIAPGEDVPVMEPVEDEQIAVNGSSFAAPHVTGAVALLQQFAAEEISFGNPAFHFRDSRRHQVIKAVLLNSADKIPVHGSKRTILNRDTQDWLASPASTNSRQPLDLDFGAGMLNVGKAIEQYRSGEVDPANVGDVGWAHERSGGVGDGFAYTFNKPSKGGDYIAVTLAWDREVTITGFDDDYDAGEEFFNEGFEDTVNNLNLYLLEKDENDIANAVAVSNAWDGTVEHIFFQVPAGGGEYKIVVQHENQDGGFSTSDGPATLIDSQVDFAVAWWAYEPSSILPGDYDSDGDIDIDDRNVWASSYGSTVFSGRLADGNLDGVIDAADYTVWRDAYDAAAVSVPEPAGVVLAALSLFGGGRRRVGSGRSAS